MYNFHVFYNFTYLCTIFSFFCNSRPHSSEYKVTIGPILDAVENHRKNLIPGQPQLDWCDEAVMVMYLNTLEKTFNVDNYNYHCIT